MAYKTVANPTLKKFNYSITFDLMTSQEFEDEKKKVIEKLESEGLSDNDLQAQIDELNAQPVPNKTLKATIQEPQLKQLAPALSALMTTSGNMDFISSGEVIFNTCCVQYDSELDLLPRIKAKLCMEISTDHVLPVSADIKKN